MKVNGIFINPRNPIENRVGQIHITVKHPVRDAEKRGKVVSIGFNPSLTADIPQPLDFPKRACVAVLRDWEDQRELRDSQHILLALPISIRWSIVIIFNLLVAIIFSLGGRGFLGFQPFRVDLLFLFPWLNWAGLIVTGSLVIVLSFISSHLLKNYILSKRFRNDLRTYYQEKDNRETFFENAYWEVRIDGLTRRQIVDGPSAGLALFFAFLDAVVKERPECRALFWYQAFEKWVSRKHGNEFAAVGAVTPYGQVNQVGHIQDKLVTLLNENQSRLDQNQSRIDLLIGAGLNRRDWQTGWDQIIPGGNLSSVEASNNVFKAEDANATDEDKVLFYFLSWIEGFLRHFMPSYNRKWRAIRIFIFIFIVSLFVGAIPGPPVVGVDVRTPDVELITGKGGIPTAKMKPNDQTRIEVESRITTSQILGCMQVLLWSFDPTLSQQQSEESEKKISTKLCWSQEKTYWFTMPDKEQVEMCVKATDLADTKVDRKCIIFERKDTSAPS